MTTATPRLEYTYYWIIIKVINFKLWHTFRIELNIILDAMCLFPWCIWMHSSLSLSLRPLALHYLIIVFHLVKYTIPFSHHQNPTSWYHFVFEMVYARMRERLWAPNRKSYKPITSLEQANSIMLIYSWCITFSLFLSFEHAGCAQTFYIP